MKISSFSRAGCTIERLALAAILFLILDLSACVHFDRGQLGVDIPKGKPSFQRSVVIVAQHASGYPYYKEIDPASPPTGTPPYTPFLVRQSDCSLTRVTIDSTGLIVEQDSGFQDFLHQQLQIPTTQDKFANGCQDPVAGIASQTGAIVGHLSNGSTVVAGISNDGVQIVVVNGSGTPCRSRIFRPSILRIPSASYSALLPRI